MQPLMKQAILGHEAQGMRTEMSGSTRFGLEKGYLVGIFVLPQQE